LRRSCLDTTDGTGGCDDACTTLLGYTAPPRGVWLLLSGTVLFAAWAVGGVETAATQIRA